MNLMRTCMTFVATTLMFVSPMAAAQRPQPPPSEQRAQSTEITGEILSINTETKTLVVKTTPDSEMKFTYSDETEIVGADKGTEGLATKAGSTVTVSYDVHGTANIALKIEVKPKQ